MVIDHLHDDETALHSCSLVSHAWVLASRHHLFHTMRQPWVTYADKILPPSPSDAEAAAMDPRLFVEFLVNAPVSVTNSVRHLYLIAHLDYRTVEAGMPGRRPTVRVDLLLEDIGRMTQYLPRLQSLSIKGLQIKADVPGTPLPKAESLRSFDLCLAHPYLDSPSCIVRLLEAMPNLQKLSWDAHVIPKHDDLAAHGAVGAPISHHLDSLVISAAGSGSQFMFDLLSGARHPSIRATIAHIELDVWFSYSFSRLGKTIPFHSVAALLAASSDSLRSLTFKLHPDSDNPPGA